MIWEKDSPVSINIRALAVAMIDRAIRDVQHLDLHLDPGERERSKNEAIAWFKRNSREDENYPYSFLWCCRVTGLDPTLTRQRLGFVSGRVRQWSTAITIRRKRRRLE